MAHAVILDIADELEDSIRKFLASSKDGGRFELPSGIEEIAIPLMMAIFESENWVVEFDYEKDKDWLDFSKRKPKELFYKPTDDFID